MITKLTIALGVSLIVVSHAWAQSTSVSESQRGSFSVTVNPVFYLLGGYSVKGFYHLPRKWSFGLAIEAGFELPDIARDQFFDNNEDITVDWDYLVGAEVRYRFNDSNVDRGFYALGTVGYEGWTIRDDAGQEDAFDNWYASIGAGYNWYPFKKPYFHVGATYNVIFILNNTEERVVGDSRYSINGVVPPSFFPTFLVGWRF